MLHNDKLVLLVWMLSAVGVIYASGPLCWFCVAMYLYSATWWVKLIEQRRQDLQRYRRQQGPWPYWLYEILPFAYVGLGVLVWRWVSDPWFAPSIMLLLGAGAITLWIRRYQRLSRPKGRLMLGL